MIRLRTSFLAAWIAVAACLSLAACIESGDQDQDGGHERIPCEDRLDCPALLGCVEGFCGHCALDRECAVTEYCHPVEQLCYPIYVGVCDIFIEEKKCPLGEFCVQGYCKDGSEVVFCTDDGGCQAGERCDRLNLVCVVDYGCNRDNECAINEVCNKATNRCESACTPETAEVVCGFGLVCDEFGRCVECFDDSQCGVGLTCNIGTNRCEGENSCFTDRDCYPGTVCNPQTRQCTVTPPDCLSSADCAEGMLCDPPSGLCVPEECRPDPLEPNDELAQAAKLGPGRTAELNLCPQDLDWFAIDLARGDRLQVIVNTDFLAADHFQIVLFDPEAAEVLQEDTLLIDHVVAQDGSYKLRTLTSDQQAGYSLIVTLSRGIPCDDDDFEPNDSALAARPIVAGTYGGLAVCPRDEDWYVLDRPLGSILQVRIEFPALQGDLDMDLLAGDAQTLVMRSATAGDSELVYVDDDPGTRFFIRVYADAQVGNSYEMQIDLLPR